MTSTQASPAEFKRIRRATIYDKEDEDYKPDLPSSPTRGRKVTTPTKAQKLGLSPRKQGKSSSTIRSITPPPTERAGPSSSPSVTLKFAGKVYRTLDKSAQGVSYSPDANFLGEPDEAVVDLERERAERRRHDLERKMLRESMSPEKVLTSKRRKVVLDESSDDESPTRSRSKRRDDALSTPTKQLLPAISTVAPRVRPSSSSTLTPPRAMKKPFAFHSPTKPASPGLAAAATLPAPISALLALHAALETALIMHLGMSGSFVASSSTVFDDSGRATVRIPNLITLAELEKMVRSSGGRECGQKELEQLVWAWTGCGMSDELSASDDEDDDCVHVVENGEDEVGGLGFIVARTRIGRGNNIVWTHGLGIAVKIKANPQLPKFELVPHSPKKIREREAQSSPPSSPSSIGKGRDGMNVVALWSQGKEARRKELTRRLKAWGRKCVREEQAQASPVYDPEQATFPIIIPPIPRAALPSLAKSHASPAVLGTSSPSPKKPRPPPSDVFGPAVAVAGTGPLKGSVMMLLEGSKPNTSPIKSSKASDRAKAMRERLAAKRAEALVPTASQAFMSTLSGGIFPTRKVSLRPEKAASAGDVVQEMQAIERETYKRNAIVSRLGNIADVVSMVSFKNAGRPVLLAEVVQAVSASPLVRIGSDEAYESLQLLCELFPSFSTLKTVERQDWLSMKRNAQASEVKAKVAIELEQVRKRSGVYA